MADSTLKEALSQYLTATTHIDSNHPKISQKAGELTKGCESDVEKARALYEFVRDSYTKEAVESYIASQVLDQGGNLCYQRAILLAALCRSVGIPARLHLQRVSIGVRRDPGEGRTKDIRFAHGLTGIYLNEAWHIYEATGNSYKWLQWTGDEVEAAGMLVEFHPDRNCLFDMSRNSRVKGELLPVHFADRTEALTEIIAQMNDF